MNADPIQNFYDHFPYPLTEARPNSSVNGANMFRILDRESRANGFTGLTFLDVGCGSGHRTLDIAKTFSKARFVGFDISGKNIEVAKHQAELDQVTNISFTQCGIDDYEAAEKFDVVIANGVLHHLVDPIRSLQKLVRFLKRDGLFLAWLCHTYGEYDRILGRRVLLTLLGDQRRDLEAGTALMREMGFSISQNRYGKSFPENMTLTDELSRDADAFLNPTISPFTFHEAIVLFQQGGLAWAGIDQVNFMESGAFLVLEETSSRPPWALDLRRLLKSEAALGYYWKLDRMEKLRVIEGLLKPTGFTIVGGHAGDTRLCSSRMAENRISFVQPET
jgi:SAM-dependent methyltransferase